jgi:hypothetical protein
VIFSSPIGKKIILIFQLARPTSCRDTLWYVMNESTYVVLLSVSVSNPESLSLGLKVSRGRQLLSTLADRQNILHYYIITVTNRHAETCWDMLRHAETCWDMLLRHTAETWWDMLRHAKTCRDILRHSETCWDMLRHAATFRFILSQSETCWDMLIHAWHAETCLTCWDMRRHADPC